jgi:3-deoxy-D-manno-octulosonic-acid transferase
VHRCLAALGGGAPALAIATQPEYLRHWGERFARYGKPVGADLPTIWLHAVSVGETRAAQPLVAPCAQATRTPHPVHPHDADRQRHLGSDLRRQCFAHLPALRHTRAMRRFLRQHRPQFGLIMETELWPNLVAACRELSVPLLLVNARLSERSANRYARFATLTARYLAQPDPRLVHKAPMTPRG